MSQVGSREYTLAGVATYGGADSAAGAQVVAFAPETAAQVLGTPGRYTAIQVVAAKGVSQSELVKNLTASLHQPGTEAITGATATAETRKAAGASLQFINMFLMTFALVALLVGSFVIYNTFSITVAQRTKDTALLRAIGAKRKQVTRSVMLEALFTGVFASAIGVVAGIGMAQGLRLILTGFGLETPAASSVVKPGTIVVSMVTGIVVTLVAAYMPARKAAKVAPIEALRDVALDSSGTSKRRAVIGTVVTVAGVAFMAQGLAGCRRRSGRPGCARSVRRHRGPRSGHRPAVRPHARHAVAAPAGHAGHARPRERDAQPASHLRNGVGVDDRCRAGGVHHRVRGIGQGVDQHVGRQGHGERVDRRHAVRDGRAEPGRHPAHRRAARDRCRHPGALGRHHRQRHRHASVGVRAGRRRSHPAARRAQR